MILHKLHWGVVAAGVALLAVGVVGVIRSWSDRGVGIIMVAGVVCLLLALVAHKITDVVVEHGQDGTKVSFALASQVVEEIRVTGLAGAAATYSFIHNQLAEDPGLQAVKVELQDQVVGMVKANAFNDPVDSDQVDKVLTSGSAAERVLVFGLLQADRTLVTVERLRKGIMASKSGNEQYHALLALDTHWSTFSPADRELLRDAVRAAPYISEDRDRAELAAKILGRGIQQPGSGAGVGTRPT